MSYILVIWTVVACCGMAEKPNADWRPIGAFRSERLCHEAAQRLAISESRYRCLVSGQ